ncbi:MAG: [ribosomal protein S18]-alanine N-acetyltransferase, partial [Alphaproteobacteria bacterium]|nr:[ribosomal protein S18]-alanine N-acetyltransferase [Alphaproteobacteria bacterium]
ILSRLAADEAEILSVAVASSQRGKGLARQLLDLNLRRLAGLGVPAVFLEVDEGNAPARRLYQRAGFRDVGRREGYYPGGKGAAALILRRDLV